MTDFNTRYKLYPHRYIYTTPLKGSFTRRDLNRETTQLNFISKGRHLVTAFMIMFEKKKVTFAPPESYVQCGDEESAKLYAGHTERKDTKSIASYHCITSQDINHRLFDQYPNLPEQFTKLRQISRPCCKIHDCRLPIIQDHQDTHRWDAFILAHGLEATYEGVESIHTRPPKGIDEIRPDKLLFHIGNTLKRCGDEKGEFNWPRGMAVSHSGEIIIADTNNHRIQAFNQFGVLVKAFGKFGCREGEFNAPMAVATTMNEEVLIADSKNKRVQVFTRRKIFKDSFPTNDEPVTIATDIYYNTIMGTNKRTIEIYRRGGKLVNRFSTQPKTCLQEMVHIHIAVNDMMNNIVVSDPADRLIKTFNYNGDMLHKFEPSASFDGLACRPVGISVLLNANIIVSDSLNHAVCMYTDRGQFVKQLVGPTDGCGSVQQCAAGPEGHLITTECSTNGKHCMKIYRFKECECHSYRPGSSKKPQTPNTYQVKTITAS